MRVSLNVRVLLLVAAVNLSIFGAGLVYLTRTLSSEREALGQRWTELLEHTLQRWITASGEVRVAQILAWPNWRDGRDAIIMGLPREVAVSDGGARYRGVFLNPVGSSHRPADFPADEIRADIVRAVVTADRVVAEHGTCTPIFDPTGAIWGGCWFSLDEEVDRIALLMRLFPWFLISTSVLTLGTFLTMRRFVLDPVAALSRGAGRVAQGDLAVRVPVPRRKDELTELIQGFNSMAETVQGFNSTLVQEVQSATQKARTAEAAALAQRQLAATGELAAGIAHEINNPLGGLLNAVERLRAGTLDDEKEVQYFALLQSGLERIQSTVGKLLRATPRPSKREPVLLARPLLDALDLVRHRATRAGISIVLHSDATSGLREEAEVIERWRQVAPVVGELGQLAQAFLNLFVNALDALEHGGAPSGKPRLDVTLRSAEGGADEVWVEVFDNGPGVSPETLPRISDPFFTTKDVGQGTGLGLAIVRQVVSAHAGRLDLESEPGRGFRARLSLPSGPGAPRRAAGRGKSS